MSRQNNASSDKSFTLLPFGEVLSDADLVDIETFHKLEIFLYQEARLLDNRRFEEWLTHFSDDAVYEVPMRLTRDLGSASDISSNGRIFSDSKSTLEIRIQRLRTEFAWAEQPPSRTRHFVTNMIAYKVDDILKVQSNLLVYRSRGDNPSYDLYCADREDTIETASTGEFRIKSRRLVLDQSNPTGNSLSIFL